MPHNHILYDVQSFSAEATKRYFQTAENAATNKDLDTNMPLAGKLPVNQSFKTMAIQVQLPPDLTLATSKTLVKEGIVRWKVGEEPEVAIPLANAAAGGGLSFNLVFGPASTDTSSNLTTQNGEPSAAASSELDGPTIPGDTAFFVELAAITSITASRVRVALLGVLTRKK